MWRGMVQSNKIPTYLFGCLLALTASYDFRSTKDFIVVTKVCARDQVCIILLFGSGSFSFNLSC